MEGEITSHKKKIDQNQALLSAFELKVKEGKELIDKRQKECREVLN
jgi:hypothetical protein